MKTPVYLDYNATTPVDKRVLETMLPFFTEQFGNAASSNHQYGWAAAEAVTIAREQIARLIGAVKEEIVFTSGATESINLAIRGVADAYATKGNHIITCATEHKAVLDTCAALSKKDMEISFLRVDKKGSINIDELKQTIKPSTILICLMYANNETGVLFPVREIADAAKQNNVLFFCDATQAVGKAAVNVLDDGIDLMAFSSHKLYGPKGCGALYVRRKNPRVRLKEQITGGGHERTMRSGTLNVPGIVGFGKAAELCMKESANDAKQIRLLRDHLEYSICKQTVTTVNGEVKNRLPHVSNLCFHLQNGASFMAELSKYMAVSSGSACSSASPEPSHVLKAMGLTDEEIKSSVRFSLGRFTTEVEINYTIKQITHVLKQLKNPGL
ncbi:MAG: cysteine desulfurase [Chitinophagaceae bacterium]|nr:cysteine desulfurase [Chitinophagaceae bacterium]